MFGEASELAKQMHLLVNNKDLHDIQFVIGPARKRMFAHRCILSGRCEVFRAMFVDHTQKNGPIEKDTPFVLSDMVPEVFLAMLDFIYTNSVTLSSKNAIDVMATALEYGLDDLKSLCEDYLVDSLEPGNACDIIIIIIIIIIINIIIIIIIVIIIIIITVDSCLCEDYLVDSLEPGNACDRIQAAQTYRLDDLKRKTLEYIENNTKVVFESKGFEELSEDTLCFILSSDKLMLDEMEVYAYVRRWASVNAVVAGKKVEQVAAAVVMRIRLPLLTLEEIGQLEQEIKKDHFLPTELMAQAWKLHATKSGEKNNPLFVKRKGTAPRECHRFLDNQ
ncbi:hypothetical protein ACOMHN_014698 [Nucella lapillus]